MYILIHLVLDILVSVRFYQDFTRTRESVSRITITSIKHAACFEFLDLRLSRACSGPVLRPDRRRALWTLLIVSGTAPTMRSTLCCLLSSL